MKKWFFSVLIGSLVAAEMRGAELAAARSTNTVVVTSVFLGELATEMRTNAPVLRAFQARVDAAEANRRSVRVWGDPQKMAGGIFASRMMREEDGDLVVGVEQKLPLFGKWQAERSLASRQWRGQELELEYQFQMMRLELSRQIFRTALTDELLAIGRDELAWLQTTASVADQRFQAGGASTIEVLRVNNERSRRALQWTNDFAARAQEARVLNRFLGRELERGWELMRLPPIAPKVEFTDRVRNLVLRFESRLKLMRQKIEEAEASVVVTERQRRPDVMVGVEERRYSGSGDFRESMVSLRMNLPWLNRKKYDAAVEREKHLVRGAELEAEDYQRFVVLEAQRVLTMAETARRTALLYRDELLPRAEISFNALSENWSAGRGTLLELLEARRILLENKAAYARAIAEQYQALLELVLCCGLADLESLEMLRPASSSASPSSEKQNNPL